MCVLYDVLVLFFFFKQKTAYERRISDWSSDVCSSYLVLEQEAVVARVVDIIRLEEEFEAVGRVKADRAAQRHRVLVWLGATALQVERVIRLANVRDRKACR